MNSPEHYLVDLLSAGPDRIRQIPGGIPEAVYHTGRLLVHRDDPLLSQLILLGFQTTPVLSTQDLDNDRNSSFGCRGS